MKLFLEPPVGIPGTYRSDGQIKEASPFSLWPYFYLPAEQAEAAHSAEQQHFHRSKPIKQKSPEQNMGMDLHGRQLQVVRRNGQGLSG